MQKLAIVTAALIVCAAPVAAQTPAATGGAMIATTPGKGVAVETVNMTATVEAIDKAKRTVTLKGPAGNSVTVAAGPEVKNFDQMKVGDQVLARYVESLTLELKKGGKAVVARTDSAMAGAAKPGEKPAAVVGREIKVTANVVAVDAAKMTVTLKGPERTVQLKLRDPEQIKLVKVGDQVDATYTEALALAVEPAAAKK